MHEREQSIGRVRSPGSGPTEATSSDLARAGSSSLSREVQRKASSQPGTSDPAGVAGPLQLDALAGADRATRGAVLGSTSVQRAAADGVSGQGSALPHGDRIQSAFGKHDVSGVKAHVGAAPTAACDSLGAHGYATGSDVAFRAAPSLHTAAHEAAHVVQQRGGVQLKGGVGQVGDRYEQHADAVADAVVAGRSAEPVLDQMAGNSSTGGGSGGVTQLDATGALPSTASAGRVVVGKAGYTYRQLPDGTVSIESGPTGKGRTYAPGTPINTAITKEIGPFPAASSSAAAPAPANGAAPGGTTSAPSAAPTAGVSSAPASGGGFMEAVSNKAHQLGQSADQLLDSARSKAQSFVDWVYGSTAGTTAGNTGATPAGGQAATPAPAAAPAAAAPMVPSTTDPLAKGLSMVGKVRYKDEQFLKGSGNLSKAEVDLLVSGSADIKDANCSTFTTWMLAAGGVDVKAKAEGDKNDLQAYMNIAVPLAHKTAAVHTAVDPKADQATQDATTAANKAADKAAAKANLAADIDGDSSPIKGAATGFVTVGIGVEVPQAQAKPGDFVQTWSKGNGGHSTIIHRVHCTGAAIFGKAGSPRLLDTTIQPSAAGSPMGNPTPVKFIMDETTDPRLVGAHVVDKVEKLGANTGGKNSEGKTNQDGVYTSAAVALSTYKKAYVGRLNSSPWANFSPATVGPSAAPAATPATTTQPTGPT